MTNSASDSPLDASVASRPAVVEGFSIEGLYGYRTVSLTSKVAATVLIARNGSGKTTLIAALDAFLRMQFTRFMGLEFERIVCKLRDWPEELVITKEQIQQLAELTTKSDLPAFAKLWDVEPLALLSLLEEDLQGIAFADLRENATFNNIYAKCGYVVSAAKEQCERLSESILHALPAIRLLRDAIKQALGKTKIVYLPTYRRIELSLRAPDPRRGERRTNVLSKLGIARTGLHAADIQFGLGDISDRLRALYSDMRFLSNQGYGKISANIISDLISRDFSVDHQNRENWPTKESLQLFFSRIRDSDQDYGRARFAPYSSIFGFPDLDRVYSGDIPEGSKAFLGYFLEQLNKVILATRGSEELVEDFINNCNRYLSGADEMPEESPLNPTDSKKLTFNRKNLAVRVVSQTTKRRVPLEALSSGEKQMISLFARLYLYPDPKIVLIDEPELSLSLAWQRKIVPDILRAPSCSQVIAITHSPFIFDNELDPYATSLHVKFDRRVRSDLFEDTGFDDLDSEEWPE